VFDEEKYKIKINYIINNLYFFNYKNKKIDFKFKRLKSIDHGIQFYVILVLGLLYCKFSAKC